MNDQKYNIYATINPIHCTVERSARDDNVGLAFLNFTDTDDLAGVEALKKFCESQKPDFFVITENSALESSYLLAFGSAVRGYEGLVRDTTKNCIKL